MAVELWQLYNEDQTPKIGVGATRDEAFGGLLHGASHVWIWRNSKAGTEMLIQRRANDKHTWPGLLDIPAAGHINLGETPEEAAIRETKEEIGLDILAQDLVPVGVHHAHLTAPNGVIENEFQFLYLLELRGNHTFNLQTSEVSELLWMPFTEFKKQIALPNVFVPHGREYFSQIIEA